MPQSVHVLGGLRGAAKQSLQVTSGWPLLDGGLLHGLHREGGQLRGRGAEEHHGLGVGRFEQGHHGGDVPGPGSDRAAEGPQRGRQRSPGLFQHAADRLQGGGGDLRQQGDHHQGGGQRREGGVSGPTTFEGSKS